MRNLTWGLLACLMVGACSYSEPEIPAHNYNQNLSPDVRFGALFEAVQTSGLFHDSKIFANALPSVPAGDLMHTYNKERLESSFRLDSFVYRHFVLPRINSTTFHTDTSATLNQHLLLLRESLSRRGDSLSKGSLIALPFPFSIPATHNNTCYYWESYFTMLGLAATGHWDEVELMLDNFSFLIQTKGYIPAGNRTYYQGRSQSPVYALMVNLLAEHKGEGTLKKYLPYLQKEYTYWMDGASVLKAEAPAYRHVVRLDDGAILNRYWDNIPRPRPEAYREDVELVNSLPNGNENTYRHIRAAAESVWLFSSRWLRDGQYMASIHTTDIIPVDLNALLYHLEQTLAEASMENSEIEQAALYNQYAQNRKNALIRNCWNAQAGFFFDYDFVSKKQKEIVSLAAVYPMYFNMVEPEQAVQISQVLQNEFLHPGGLVSTLNNTGQLWDAPYGTASMQWISIVGLRNYDQTALADSIKMRWIRLNLDSYKQNGTLSNTYNVSGVDMVETGDGDGEDDYADGVLIKLLFEE